MKRLIFAALLGGMAFVATAQPPPFAPATEPHDLRAADAKNEAVNPFCVQETGSRITAAYNRRASEADKKCAPVPGHVWSRRDIERTGALDMAEALRQLDPSIH